MKIVHVVLSAGADYTDGWSYQENTLPKLQHELGCDISLITSTTSSLVKNDRSTTQGRYIYDGIEIIRIKPSFQLFENKIAWFNTLLETLECENPDLVFLHGTNFCSLGKVFKYKKKHPEKIVFFDSHVTYENSINKLRLINKYIIHKGLWKHINKKYESMFSRGYYVAPQVKKCLVEMYNMNPDLLYHLPMGTNVPKELFDNQKDIRSNWRRNNNILDDDYVLITGGRFRESKKLFELITAFKKVHNSKIKLVAFGRFEDTGYENRIIELIGNDSRIKLLGWLENDESLIAYLSSDLAVFSGTQSVIWRTAIACGLPVICNYTDGAEEMDFNGNLIFVHDDNIQEWYEAIQSVVNSREQQKRMKIVTDTLAKPFFTERRVAQMIIDDYRDIINQNED